MPMLFNATFPEVFDPLGHQKNKRLYLFNNQINFFL